MSSKWCVDLRAIPPGSLGEAMSSFSWPVRQADYDRLSLSMIRLLEAEYEALSADPALRDLLALRASDIRVELDGFASCLLDVQTARERGLALVYSDEALNYRALEAGEARGESAFQRRVRSRSQPARRAGPARRLASRARASGRQALLVARSRLSPSRACYYVGGNELSSESQPGHAVPLDRVFAGMLVSRPHGTVPARIEDFAAHLADAAVEALDAEGCAPPEHARAYLRRLVRGYLGSSHAHLRSGLSRGLRFTGSTLFTGTGGNYASRLAAFLVQRDGGFVARFTHGGDRGLFDDRSWAMIELPFADCYVAHGVLEAARMRERVGAREPPLFPAGAPVFTAAGSLFHRRLLDRVRPVAVRGRPRRVMVVSASFNGDIRQLPAMKHHDMVYADWHIRLLKQLGTAGHDVVVKRHPKGQIPGRPLFAPYANRELLRVPFVQVLDDADVFVFDFAGSALAEALCTDRNIVVIDIAGRPFDPVLLPRLSKACHILKADTDERNRVVVDDASLRDAVEAPCDLAARRELVQGLLLQRSDDFDDLCPAAAGR